jgi:hypothetical protein
MATLRGILVHSNIESSLKVVLVVVNVHTKRVPIILEHFTRDIIKDANNRMRAFLVISWQLTPDVSGWQAIGWPAAVDPG